MGETIKGINVVIGGETTGLVKALAGVNKQAAGIQSELKQVEKLLKLDPSNIELLTQKHKLLGDAVGTAKEKLAGLKETQSQIAQQLKDGKISEEAYRDFRRNVIAAEEEVKRLEKSLKTSNVELQAFGAKMGEVGNKANELGGKLTPISAAAGAVVVGMGALAVKAGQTADEINTLSKVTGVSVESLQKFKMAEEVIDVSTESMAKGLAKLTKSMDAARDGSDKQRDAFAKLHVKITDSSGQLRDNEAVMNDVVDALSKVKNETERDAIAFELFGKSAQELNPLILGGADALKKIGEEAEKAGLIMSQAALDDINAFNDELDTTKAVLQAAGLQLGATIGKEFLPILQDLAKGIQSFSMWLKDLDPTVLKVIVVIASMIAVIAPLLMIIGQMAMGIQGIIGLVGVMGPALAGVGAAIGAVAAPALTVVAAIVAVVATCYLLYEAARALSDYLPKVWENIKTDVQTLRTSVISAFKKMYEDALDVFERIKSYLTNFVNKMFGIGKDIVLGIWEGIKSMASWIYNKVKEFISGIVTAVKDTLGIHSPSRVFAEIGTNMSLGLVEGIRSQSEAVSGAVNGMTSPTQMTTITKGGDTSYGDVHVTISPSDLKELNDVTEFFSMAKKMRPAYGR